MIEQSVDASEEAPVAQQAPAGSAAGSAGALLRRAREAQGLHIAALAVALKVPVRKLEALEADRYELLTDVVFTRALAASVCRALKIDAAPIMERLPRSSTPELGREGNAQNVPFRMPHDRAALALPEVLTRPAVLAALVLVVGAVLLVVIPGRQAADTSPGGARTDAVALPAGSVASAAVPEAVLQPASAAAELVPAPVQANPPAPSVPVASSPPAPLAPAAGAASASAAGAAATASRPSAAASAAALAFRTTNPSWIEVVDAQGTPLLRRSVGPNEAVEVSGPAPLRVTVGSVGHTRVDVRGKPYDLAAVTRDNVARFEVR